MSEEENLQVKMEEVSFFETSRGGLVIIYKVKSDGLLNKFYLVTFDDSSNEEAWGLGPTPEAALESAANRWNQVEDSNNPFKEVLAQLQK